METRRFVMLDMLNTVSGNKYDRSYPCVQIIYPSDMNSYIDNRAATKFHPENGLKHKERKKNPFTISLNLDTEY